MDISNVKTLQHARFKLDGRSRSQFIAGLENDSELAAEVGRERAHAVVTAHWDACERAGWAEKLGVPALHARIAELEQQLATATASSSKG